MPAMLLKQSNRVPEARLKAKRFKTKPRRKKPNKRLFNYKPKAPLSLPQELPRLKLKPKRNTTKLRARLTSSKRSCPHRPLPLKRRQSWRKERRPRMLNCIMKTPLLKWTFERLKNWLLSRLISSRHWLTLFLRRPSRRLLAPVRKCRPSSSRAWVSRGT